MPHGGGPDSRTLRGRRTLLWPMLVPIHLRGAPLMLQFYLWNGPLYIGTPSDTYYSPARTYTQPLLSLGIPIDIIFLTSPAARRPLPFARRRTSFNPSADEAVRCISLRNTETRKDKR